MDLESSIAGTFLILSLFGYVSKSSYDEVYYGYGYIPSQNKSSFNRFLNHTTWGISIVLFILYIFMLMSLIVMYLLKLEPPVHYTIILLFMTAYILAITSSMLLGFLMKKLTLSHRKNEVIIKTLDGKVIKAIEIYYDDEHFIYYLNESGEWCLIRKAIIDDIKKQKKAN